MNFLPSKGCHDIVNPLYDAITRDVSANLTRDNVISLMNYCDQSSFLEVQNSYTKPMVWIGVYIAVASILCIIAMGADLLHGFRDKKLWFPCKYFTLNAASITVITVAMKLPVDLSTLLPGHLDQTTKLGSMAFMCMMMANLMPSLASMDNKTLFANVIGLSILVITIVANICIQVSTGVIEDSKLYFPTSHKFYTSFKILAYIYVAMLLWLLIIMISSAITIPSSKKILEFKYQATTKRTLDDKDNLTTMVEKLKQYVVRYWVMAESGSPQFVMASNQLSSSTSGIICVITLLMELLTLIVVATPKQLYSSYVVSPRFEGTFEALYRSDYKWSMAFILVAQMLGIAIGSIAPIFRCFTILNFNLFTKWNKNYFMVFKVEKYWIQKLCEWKESNLTFLSGGGSWSRSIVRNLKNLFIVLCIGIQKVVVVSSKMIGLIPTVLTILVVYCFYSWKSLVEMLFTLPNVSEHDDVNKELSDYVLQLEDEMELGDKTLKRISNYMNNLIQNAEKGQNKDLLVFLDTSSGFKGVENFDSDQIEALTSVKLVNSWSLPVVTLTCIAISLPNINNSEVDRLLKNVSESLPYAHLVEEMVNNTCEHGNIRKATMTLWYEVEEKCTWLENNIGKGTFKGKTSEEVLGWFVIKSEEIVLKINKTTHGQVMVNTPKNLILANSMYRTAQTILFNYQISVQPINEKEFFALLSSMIADILRACFTNIPRVIEMKCRESAIEKRESSVVAAAKLFGRTKEILKRLEGWELPIMDPDKMVFIDEWRLYFKQANP
ncbi:uncharacterized protein [Rutidosis leptorrhynchoides]|uniref:uncharacterized protein n=1 Tax=Rutidosis leptorrhynchoides TaxID=125765 RepID=UPI003A999E78